MKLKINYKNKPYNRSGDMYTTILDNGYKVTQLITNQAWCDENGNLVNIDRTPIRWDIVCKQ